MLKGDNPFLTCLNAKDYFSSVNLSTFKNQKQHQYYKEGLVINFD